LFLPGLETILLASLTHALDKSPKQLMNVRHEVPRDILVQDEQTGASRWKAPALDWAAIMIAILGNFSSGKIMI